MRNLTELERELIDALFFIRAGASYQYHNLPKHSEALNYGEICQVAADALDWNPGNSLEDVVGKLELIAK